MPPAAARAHSSRHRRSIDVQIYARGDGLWEVDAQLTDTRTRRCRWRAASARPASRSTTCCCASWSTANSTSSPPGREPRCMPYPGDCDAHGDPYARLVGLNLMRGFRHAVQRAARRRARLHPPHRAGPGAADRRRAGLRRRRGRHPRRRAEQPQRPSRSTAATRCAPTALSCASTTRAGTDRPPSTTPRRRFHHSHNRSQRASMKIHEYQGKELLRQFGIPVPRGYPAFSVREARRGRAEARRPGLGGEGADPRRRPRQGRRREARALARRGQEAGRRDPRHAAQDPPDRPRRPEGAPPADRRRRRHQEGVLRRRGDRPRHAEGRA